MWYRLEQLSDGVQRAINNMDSQQWIVVSVVAIILGAIFLRGYGSRNSY
jgi:hypothetical protein